MTKKKTRVTRRALKTDVPTERRQKSGSFHERSAKGSDREDTTKKGGQGEAEKIPLFKMGGQGSIRKNGQDPANLQNRGWWLHKQWGRTG